MDSQLLILLRDYWSEISLSFGAVATYFLGRNKRKQESEVGENEIVKGELENVDGALKIYRRMLDDLGHDLEKLNEAYNELYTKFTVATDKIQLYEKKIKSLSFENKMLMKQINTCEFDCEYKRNGNKG